MLLKYVLDKLANMIDRILKIDIKERKAFKQHFLKGVILAITFDKDIKSYFQNPLIIDFFKNKGYSEITEIKHANFKITIDNDTPTAEQTNSTIGYTCVNNRNNQIQIINNRFVFVHNTYENYESLNDEIRLFTENIFTKFSASIQQVGYRKINTIVIREIENYTQITELFNENLFNFLKCDLFDFNDLENYRDNFTLSKNDSKIIINTSCAKIKNIENSYEIVVDTDIIKSNIANLTDIYETIDEINQLHFDTFCWITSQKMKNIMNGVF